MSMIRVLSTRTLLGLTVCIGCTDRLSGPEAVKLVDAVEHSLSPNAGHRALFMGGVWEGDLRLRAASTAVLHRDGQVSTYRAVVFERVIVSPSGLDTKSCAGTRWAAYFWRDRGARDFVAFLPGGWFDQRAVPVLGSCPREGPTLGVGTPNEETWLPTSVEGDIAPGVVTSACAFLAPEAARYLREEHGVTCELTRHHVWFRAELSRLSRPGNSRVDLPSTEIIGVRYTIHCDGTARGFPHCGRDWSVHQP